MLINGGIESGTVPTVSGSICPTNWSLPDFTEQVGEEKGTAPSYNNLTAAYGIVANTEAGVNRIMAIPLSFPRAGGFGDGGLINRSGSGNGYYWSSRPSSGTFAYYLYFSSTAYINRGDGTRHGGRSVRCVVTINGGIDTDKSYGKLVYVYTGATENSWTDTETDPIKAAKIAGQINKLLAEPTEFVYSESYSYGGTRSSRPIGYYWFASVYSATGSRDLNFNINGTTRDLGPQGSYNKGYAIAVRCVGAGSGGVAPLNNFVMWL